MENYQKWLVMEKEWIGAYCKKTLRRSLLIMAPAVIILLALLMGGLAAVGGDDPIESAIVGAFGGAVISLLYFLILLAALRAGRYVKKIEKSVRALKMEPAEKDRMARELLTADPSQTIEFKMTGPGSKGTPARFIATEHYAYLAGGYPYAILVRLSDVQAVRPSEEKRQTTEYRAKSRTLYTFVLFQIEFWGGEQQPLDAMGFFSQEIRNRALAILQKNGAPVEL